MLQGLTWATLGTCLPLKSIFLPGTQCINSYQKKLLTVARLLRLQNHLRIPTLAFKKIRKFHSHWGAIFPQGNSLPIRKFPFHCEALYPLGTSLSTRKLPSHWKAPFPLESSLPTRNIPSHYQATFLLGTILPTVKTSFILGSSLPKSPR